MSPLRQRMLEDMQLSLSFATKGRAVYLIDSQSRVTEDLIDELVAKKNSLTLFDTLRLP